MEDSEQSFFSVDDVLGTGKSVARQKRALSAHASSPRIDRVLHVGQFARRDRARTKCARCADADRGNDLCRRQIKHSTRSDRRRDRDQGGVMLTIFTLTWSSYLAETHLNFVGD